MTDFNAATTDDHRRGGQWRALLGLAGVLTFTGGGMHPQAPDGLSMKEDLAFMMDDSSWVPGHTLLAIGVVLLLVGLVVAHRRNALPAAARVLPFAIGATALYAVEAVSHTVAVLGKDDLAAGDMPPVVLVHLVLAVVAYPLFGTALGLLAWRLLGTWAVPLRPFAVLGIVAGVATVLAAPLTILLAEPAFSALFPVAGIGTAAWLVVACLAGRRQTAPRMAPAAV